MEKKLRRVLLKAADHWLWTALAIAGVAVFAGAVGAIAGGADGVGLVETCLGVVLAIFIFAWTLSGFAAHRADLQRADRAAFARELSGTKNFAADELPQWAKERLALVMRVDQHAVEDELVLWLVEQRPGSGGRTVLAVTRKLWYLRVTAQRGGRVVRLGTDERVDPEPETPQAADGD